MRRIRTRFLRSRRIAFAFEDVCEFTSLRSTQGRHRPPILNVGSGRNSEKKKFDCRVGSGLVGDLVGDLVGRSVGVFPVNSGKNNDKNC